MTALYNEIEPYAAAWLRNLVAAGHIAHGSVDERSVAALEPADVRGAVQFHTFAGIGVWSYALRLAGWSDDRPVWTGSCPCQPFSVAGKRKGTEDERHLWPDWFRLIRECRPPVVFGEQVASPDGYHWLDAVLADLEGAGYTVGAAVLPAASVGAPHIRHRIFLGAVRLADAGHGAQPDRRLVGGAQSSGGGEAREQRLRADSRAGSDVGGLGDANEGGLQRRGDTGGGERVGQSRPQPAGASADARGVGIPEGHGWLQGRRHAACRGGTDGGGQGDFNCHAGPVGWAWADAEWLPCRDGKWRPAQPGAFPLAHGAPARVGRLRAYGNAIVPQAAAAFIVSFMEAVDIFTARRYRRHLTR